MFQRLLYTQTRSGETFLELRRFKSYFVKVISLRVPNEDVPVLNIETQQEVLKSSLVPLWKHPYNEQLKLKNQFVSEVVSYYYSTLHEHLSKPTAKRPSVLPPRPEINEIHPSPVLYNYRTRDRYSVGPGLDDNPKTVGHLLPARFLGRAVCVPPIDVICPTRHTQVAQAFQDYIRSSALPAFRDMNYQGYWSQIQVRSNFEGDTMLLVRMHPQKLTQAELDDECKKLSEYFKNGQGSICKLHSLYFQPSPFQTPSGKKMKPYRLLFGNKHLMEKLGEHTFALSPASFFQSNRQVAEIMYNKIITAANLSSATSILDLGCGIGTISVFLSPFVRETVGIDMIKEAIQDAQMNANLNNVRSSLFISGKVEEKINEALQWVQPSKDIVAILNPGRSGVDVSLIRALREARQINKVIYVSCQPCHGTVVQNIIALIKPYNRIGRGIPFSFKSVVPVDMFPQTAHCEIVMSFER